MPYQSNDTILDKYRIEALLGRGAFAEVYRASHLALNAPRALKILRKDAPGLGSTEFSDFHARFQLEARLGARLDHPNVIRVHDFEQDGETLILVMEYARGGSLSERLAQARDRDEQIPIGEAVRIAIDVTDGLLAIHALDAVHRDLKPSNILFDKNGRAKVADVGLAQIPGGPSMRSQISMAAPHPGTPGYMSPEQESISNYLTFASDVYALGLVLFEMLTGRVYRSQRPGTRAGELRDDIPGWLDDLLARMLAKDVEGRPWDGKETAGFLQEGLKRENAKREEQVVQQKAEEKAHREAQAKAKRQAEEKARLEAERLQAENQRIERESQTKADAEKRAKERAAQQAAEITRLENDIQAALIGKRWDQAKRLIAQLENLAPEARRASERYKARLPKFWQRIPAWGWVVGIVALLLGVGIGTVLIIGGLASGVSTPHAAAPDLQQNTATIDVTEITIALETATLLPPTITPFGETFTPWPAITPSHSGSPNPIMDDYGVSMALIPAGPFEMGSTQDDSDASSDEFPQHAVYLDAYYIDQTEVTNAMFAQCVAADICDPPGGSNYGDQTYADHPVVYVSWNDAQAYCEWRGARLSTEAEWEKAARGGLEGKQYPWGDEGPVCTLGAENGAKYYDNAGCDDTGTEPVMSYSANGYGLYDMVGNVWEWVADWYDREYYGTSPSENPTGPESGEYRILRGGSWDDLVGRVRSANRDRYTLDSTWSNDGFRCAHSP